MLSLVTGGSGSGKSEYAEKLAVDAHSRYPEGKLYYVATMYPYDEECVRRIERHRSMRSSKGFTTIECYTHLEQVRVTEKDVVLLECMSNLLANEMYMEEGGLAGLPFGEEAGAGAEVILTPLFALAERAAHLIVVTNEVFSDGAVYEEGTREYIRLLGKINCEIGKRADRAAEVVCGIPIAGKSEAAQRPLSSGGTKC